MNKFRKRPVVVTAAQWEGDELALHDALLARGQRVPWIRVGDDLFVDTKEGRMRANRGDWVIKGIAGEFYPCKPEIFEQIYEPIPADDNGEQ